MPQTVLVIEDDKAIAHLWEELLEDEGYEVRLALTGTNALALLPVTRAHLVICDLALPDMKGEDICSLIRGLPACHHLPILVVTAKHDIPEWLMEDPLIDIVQKPFDIEDVVERLAHWLLSLKR